MTMDIPPPLAGAAIKSTLDHLTRQQKDKAVLVPHLKVLGKGTGALYAFNLVIRNIGTAPAYGLQVGVPWNTFQDNKGAQGRITEFWEPRGNWSMRAWNHFFKSPVPSWLGWKSLFWTKDVGITLAPGEEVEMYFGQASCKNQPIPIDAGLVWKTGQITWLYIFWREPFLWWRLWRHRLKLPFAIHTAQSSADRATCALPYWGNAG